MTGANIVAEIVNILVSGLTSLGTGIGSGIANFASSLAFQGTGDQQTLSVYFVLVLVFAGVSLAIGLTTKIFNWLSSLGN